MHRGLDFTSAHAKGGEEGSVVVVLKKYILLVYFLPEMKTATRWVSELVEDYQKREENSRIR
jgi:hypothetical protein